MHSYYNKDTNIYGDSMSYEGRYLLDPKYMTKRDLRHYYRYYNMAKNRGRFKKVIAVIFCICFFSYLLLDFNLKTTLIRLRDRFDFIPRVEDIQNMSRPYFVNTPGCRMPYFPITDENILQFMFHPQIVDCPKPLTRTSDIGSILLFNMNEQELRDRYDISDLSSVRCYYEPFKRVADKLNKFSKKVPFRLDLNNSIQIPPGIEFISVACKKSDNIIFYQDYHFFIIDKSMNDQLQSKNNRKKENLHRKRTMDNKQYQKTSIPLSISGTNESVDRVSVMILGIDSLSHLNFLRQMRRSAAYIHDNLEYAEFWGYNKVGDNTYANIVPVLTGLDENELTISCLEPVKNVTFDRCNFIWKRFKELRYQTVFAEDTANYGIFQYSAHGFKEQSTDYLLQPIMYEMEKHFIKKTSKSYEVCFGGRHAVDVVLEMINKLLPYMQNRDFFSFFWTMTITHDLWNMPQILDEGLVNTFKQFDKYGLFNKTVIFLVSDHGLRFGSFRETYQGTIEDRQPLLIALYPHWFREKYATAIKNLEMNTKQLITPFDLYATLLDLLDLRKLQDSQLKLRAENIAESETMPRGISLFLPIPSTRNCDSAGVSSHWCLCYARNELPTNDVRAQRAARFVITLINKRLQPHPQCRVLYLNSIMDAIILEPHENIAKSITNGYYSIEIALRLQTKPGLGLFEATVHMSNGAIALAGTISRLNLYGSQSFCIDEKKLKMFCYCHR